MIKALAAGEHEGTRGVTAWCRLTRDHRGYSPQRILGLVGRVFQLQRCVMMSDISSHLELWESRMREYEKLVFQTAKIQTKVPDSCKVFIVRSLVPKKTCPTFTPLRTTRRQKSTSLSRRAKKGTPILTTKENTTNLFPWKLMHCLPRC